MDILEHGFLKLGFWNKEHFKTRLGKFGIWRNHRLKDPRIVHKLAWEIWSVKGI